MDSLFSLKVEDLFLSPAFTTVKISNLASYKVGETLSGRYNFPGSPTMPFLGTQICSVSYDTLIFLFVRCMPFF